MRTIIFILILFSCAKPKNSIQENRYILDAQESYYRRIPDAPLDLYCFINDRVSAKEREELCKRIMFDLSGNLTVDLGITIEGGKIKKLEFKTFYFTDQNAPVRDSISWKLLERVLHEIDLQKIATLKDIESEDFVLRMQVERFCTGYIQITKPNIVPDLVPQSFKEIK